MPWIVPSLLRISQPTECGSQVGYARCRSPLKCACLELKTLNALSRKRLPLTVEKRREVTTLISELHRRLDAMG